MHEVRRSVRENQLSDSTLVQPHHYQRMLTQCGRGWVAEVDGRIIGFAIADLERSNIWALFVTPEFEGRGIGRQLHDEMLEWLFGAGVEQVWLSTDAGTRAERFYACAGWRLLDRDMKGESRFVMSRAAWLTRSTGA